MSGPTTLSKTAPTRDASIGCSTCSTSSPISEGLLDLDDLDLAGDDIERCRRVFSPFHHDVVSLEMLRARIKEAANRRSCRCRPQRRCRGLDSASPAIAGHA